MGIISSALSELDPTSSKSRVGSTVRGIGNIRSVGDAFDSLVDIGQTIVDPLGVGDIVGQAILDYLAPDIDYSDRKISSRGPTNPRRVVYGTARLGGQVAYIESTGTNDEFLDIIYILASHPCDSIGDIYFEDKLSTDEKYTGKFTLITSTDGLGVIDPVILANTGIDNSRYKFMGLTYLYARFQYDDEVYQGVPNVSAILNGKNDILDPRTNTTGFTANSALCELDWLITQMGATESQIDFDSWSLAADNSDTLVAAKDSDGNDTTEPRFELNGTILLSGSKLDSLSRMAQNGGVQPRLYQGLWSAIVQDYVAPEALKVATDTVIPLFADNDIIKADSTLFTADEGFDLISTFDENDLLSFITVATGSNKQDKINTVKGSFINPESDYEQIEYPILQSDDYETDDLEVLEQTFDYQLVTSASQCRRLSKIRLEKSRFGLAFSATFRNNIWPYVVGSRINFSYARFGWVDRVFLIVDREIDGLNGINVTLKEDSADIYSWNEGDALNVIVPDPLNLPDPDVVNAPTDLTMVEELYIANTSKAVKARAIFTWVAGDITAKNFAVEGSFDGGDFRIFSDYIIGETYSVDDLEPGNWTFRVRAENGIGAKSPYTNLVTSIAGKTAPPADVTGFTEEIKPFSIVITWDAVPDLDIREYEIRLGSTWDTGTTLQVINALRWEWETRPTGNEMLFIKAIDTSDNYSTNATEATVSIQNPASPSPVTATVADNNVQLFWSDSTTSFNIDKYEIRKGSTFESGEVKGTTKGTFISILEVVGGQYTYWVKATDVQGNEGAAASVNANVDNVPDFILQANQLLDLNGGTKVNMLADIGESITADSTVFTADSTAVTADIDDTFVLLGPANLTETWQEHFEGIIAAGSFPVPHTADDGIIKADSTLFTVDEGNPTIRQLQTDNGLPFYLQPTLATGSYEETIDFGGLFSLSRIQLIPDVDILDGSPTVTYTISYSDDDITYIPTVGLEAVGINFQFVRVLVEVAAPNNIDLLRINSLRLRLDVKLKDDSGSVVITDTVNPTPFSFNIAFVDINSVQTSANGVDLLATYNFTDVPNPTGGSLNLQDLNTGALVAGTVSWQVRGV